MKKSQICTNINEWHRENIIYKILKMFFKIVDTIEPPLNN